jgi:antitoxin component YwqK of YwqJK toxin-antitoxin module
MIEQTFFPNGEVESRFETNARGEKHGMEETFYENGNRRSIITYTNGVMNGICKFFYENGTIDSITPYKNGNVHGIAKTYHENGNIESITPCENGYKNGIQEFFDDNGGIISRTIYVNNEKNGYEELYSEDGKLERRCEYRNDKKNGRMQEFDEIERVIGDYIYENDILMRDLRSQVSRVHREQKSNEKKQCHNVIDIYLEPIFSSDPNIMFISKDDFIYCFTEEDIRLLNRNKQEVAVRNNGEDRTSQLDVVKLPFVEQYVLFPIVFRRESRMGISNRVVYRGNTNPSIPIYTLV